MRFTFIQKILISVVVLFLVLIVLLFGVKENPLVTHYSLTGYNFWNTLTYTLVEKPVLSFSEFVNAWANFEDTSRELELLQSEVEQIALIKEQYAEVLRENEALKQSLELHNTATDYQMVSSNVIARDVDGWYNFVTIDVGEEDGVQVNQAVMTNQGLVGKVYQVSRSSSIVKLITSVDGLSKISLKISQEQPVEAILENYSAEEECFLIRVLDNNTEIEVGVNVVTSAMGGIYPNGILVGQVERVETVDYLLGKIVYVRPSANFKNLSIVNVIQREMDTISQ
ncbi:MAG: rod shape-determining protein MreC [Erysipelotrichales bacterium]|nr:rod shape-determining protein MreC [Erysipelotrichales bacterium]